MTYQKPQVEIVKFDFAGFMTTSGTNYSSYTSPEALLSGLGINYNNTNSFKCDSIQTYGNNCTNAVTIGNFTFTLNGKSNNWRASSN